MKKLSITLSAIGLAAFAVLLMGAVTPYTFDGLSANTITANSVGVPNPIGGGNVAIIPYFVTNAAVASSISNAVSTFFTDHLVLGRNGQSGQLDVYDDSGNSVAELVGGNTGMANIGQLLLGDGNTIVFNGHDGSASFANGKATIGVDGGASFGDGTVTIDNGGNITVNTSYAVAGNQVVGAQQPAIADATGALDVVARVNDILAAMRAHGLIAP